MPFTRTRPATMSCSAARRDAMPPRARIFWRRSMLTLALPLTLAGMRRVERPWGYELIWAETARYVGKVLPDTKRQRLSRQFHDRKEETFLIQSGEMDLEIGQGADMKTIHSARLDEERLFLAVVVLPREPLAL